MFLKYGARCNAIGDTYDPGEQANIYNFSFSRGREIFSLSLGGLGKNNREALQQGNINRTFQKAAYLILSKR